MQEWFTEGLRRVPEGGVYACTIHHLIPGFTRASSGASRTDASYSIATLTELPGVLATQAPDVRFDRILGRNALVREPDKVAIIHRLAKLLRHSGYLCWGQLPRHTQRLYRLLDPTSWMRTCTSDLLLLKRLSMRLSQINGELGC